ncbi:MAG: hypothetical protein HUJ27_12245 [Rhodobacteraceae bacterium]|nr:hypothetical protein [Paracoccaceae bacterium]
MSRMETLRPAARAADRVLLVGRAQGGHRAEYLSFAKAITGGRHGGWLRAFVQRGPVLVLMIEDGFLLFLSLCLWRAALGRRTVGFLFRPLPALRGQTLRLRCKRRMLRGLRRHGNVRCLTLLPRDLMEGGGLIADDGIHDFQLWDRPVARPVSHALRDDIRRAARGRMVIAAPGSLNALKGFPEFVTAFRDSPALRGKFLFAGGGRVAPGLEPMSAVLKSSGGFCLPRHLSEPELAAFHEAADAVWCLYDAAYDQASGIYGRAVQRGCPVIVRRGSLLHRLAEVEAIPHLALVPEDLPGLTTAAIPAPDPDAAVARAARMRHDSLERLDRALWGAAG